MTSGKITLEIALECVVGTCDGECGEVEGEGWQVLSS